MSKWFLGFITRKSTIPKFDLLSQHFSFPISLRFRYFTTTSESNTHPFPVSYLINNFGFSPQSALKAFNHRQVRFKSPDKPNSVINFFKNHHFSHPNIRIIITNAPWLLSSKPHKSLLPKFQFFLSKGVSSSDIVSLLTESPRILKFSLEKRIIPLFELLSRFLKTNQDVIVCLIRHTTAFQMNTNPRMLVNINLMTDFGVCDSNIARLLQERPSIFGSNDLIKSLEEVKGLGFDPSMTIFGTALMAKKCISKKLWNQKVDVFKKWGWSDEAVLQTFRSYPKLMMVSIDKVNLVMTFWVNQLGWNSLELTKCPLIFSFSLEKRVIPRASILQFLLMKGLRKKNASLVTPFIYTEKLFLDKFVFNFKEESDYLLKLYQDKMKLAYSEENKGMPLTE
ncbi:transcription termination factor MTERF5, chloroplastic [Trifolium repens]|nr:transcription termination factor MTERF5, chloroplastic [Trifolium repens]